MGYELKEGSVGQSKSIVAEHSMSFAVRVVGLCRTLCEQKEFVLSRQLLRSGTSVGANIREALNAQSAADFIAKLHIAQKECDESIYWLELLTRTNYIGQEQFIELEQQARALLKMIRSIILTKRENIAANP